MLHQGPKVKDPSILLGESTSGPPGIHGTSQKPESVSSTMSATIFELGVVPK